MPNICCTALAAFISCYLFSGYCRYYIIDLLIIYQQHYVFGLQNDSKKVSIAQYMKDIMNWSCTEDHSKMVI